MGKALELPDDLMTSPPPVPLAAQTPSAKMPTAKAVKVKAAEPVVKVPLQLNLSAEDVKAIKRAAFEADQTVSDYVLACFLAFKPAVK